MNKKIGFGIIGCGVISKWHAEAILSDERAELIGATDKNINSAEKFAEEYKCKLFESYEDMLESDDVDVVCICTPSGLHASLAISAAKSKKNIVIEKPMAITHEQLEEMTEACEENKVKVCVISQMRFTKSVQFLKKVIDEGKIGKIILADVYMKYYRSPQYYSSSNWRGTWSMDGGGALMNQGIHGIDLIHYLVGPIKSVCGKINTQIHEIQVEDTANALVEYENGAMGVIQGTTSVLPGYPRRIEVCGTKGSFVLEEDTIIKWNVPEVPLPKELENMESKVNGSNISTEIATKYHKLQISDMVSAVIENKEPLVNLHEGRKAVEIILSIYESSQNNEEITLNNKA